MANNHLLIGLGGTGCGVVRELKKKLFMKWKADGNSGPLPEIPEFKETRGNDQHVCRVATLSIDSSKADLDGEGQKENLWTVFGATLGLKDNEKVLIDPSGLATQLSNLEKFPGMEPWLKDEMEFVREIAKGATGPVGCNQIRRLGAAAMAASGNFSKVTTRIEQRLDLLETHNRGADIHIACTLASGTGSGGIVHLLAQVQKLIKSRQAQGGRYDVFLHTFVTSKDPDQKDTGNFFANQYGALEELNAFRLVNYMPWDIDVEYPSPSKRITATLDPGEQNVDIQGTVKSISLLSETTTGQVPRNLPQQTEITAEFLFQVCVGQMGELPQELRYALTLENRQQYPADEQGGDRATCFISLGVQKLAIPDREIREKFAYSFSRQYLLRSLYHNWDNNYIEVDRAYAPDLLVENRRSDWRVNKEHLDLDLVQAATGDHAECSLYFDEWSQVCNALADQVRADLGDAQAENWMADFDNRVNDYEASQFRGRGVANYFSVRREATFISGEVRRARHRIESELVHMYETLHSDYPIFHLASSVGYLKNAIEEDHAEFEAELEVATKSETGHIANAHMTREEKRLLNAKGGLFALGKRRKLFAGYVQATIQLKYWQTKQLSIQFALEYIPRLLLDIGSLERTVIDFDSRLKALSSEHKAEISKRIVEAGEQRGAAVEDVEVEVNHLVDTFQINSAIKDKFLAQKPLVDKATIEIAETLRALRGERLEFQAYLERMPVHEKTGRVGGAFAEMLRSAGEEASRLAHQTVKANDSHFPGIFGLNIVKKLYADYGGNVNSMETMLRSLLGKAMPLISFDATEPPMNLAPGGGAKGPLLLRCVFVPQCTDVPREFHDSFVQALGGLNSDAAGIADVRTIAHVVPENRCPTEIVILSIAYFFSARRTTAVKELASKYRLRLSSPDEKARRRALFEIYTETHEPTLPSLLQPTSEEVKNQTFPYAVLGAAIGLLQVTEQPTDKIRFGTMDEFGRVTKAQDTSMVYDVKSREEMSKLSTAIGREVPSELGCLYTQYKSIREAECRPLRNFVVASLHGCGKTKDEILSQLSSLSGTVFLMRGKRQDDAEYQRFEKAELAARKIIDRLP